MKKVARKAGHFLALAATLVVFLISCANPVADMSSNAALGEAAARATVAPTTVDYNATTVLDLDNDSTIDALKFADGTPVVLGRTYGPITITKLWYQGPDATLLESGNSDAIVGFDFTSTMPVLAVFVKGGDGGNIYDYRPDGTLGDTELHTKVNKSGKFAAISHVDIAWSVTTPTTTVPSPTTTTTLPNVVYYTLSGTVFHDLNNDGALNGAETGLSGVTLTLNGGSTATSSSDGSYEFTGLLPGAYTVASGGKSGFFATPYDTPVESKSATIVASSVGGVNFGLSYESISGFAFKDTNADGAKSAGENGIGGVTVSLSGFASSSASTGSDGSYLFDHLKGGSASYTVAAGNVSGDFHTPYLAPVTSWTGTASASNVNFGYSHETVTGVVFYDANKSDSYQSGEPLLSGFTVRLSNGASTTSASDGSYTFDNLIGATTYTVSADDRAGFVHSVAASRSVTPANAVPAVANFGFAVDYNWINGKLANGFTIGYWKTNLDKAIANKTNGIQVSKATLVNYVSQLSSFALWPLNPATLQAASDILSKTGSAPTDLLAKQLMGSEFNYASGAYIGGNALATSFFLYDGEYMLANAGAFSSTQLLAQKDKYDAYNNSHGGAVIF
jgi:hypothetical protein